MDIIVDPELFLAEDPVQYSQSEMIGVGALVGAGALSALSILLLAVFVVIKMARTSSKMRGLFLQTHLTPYFLSLFISNIIQAVGSILNVRWLRLGGVVFDDVCVTQGVAKNIGNVGTSLWSLIIAGHIFHVLFLRSKQRHWTLVITVLGTWLLICGIDLYGPMILQHGSSANIPFFGVSGFWCWITSEYPLARIFLEYIFMFISAALCAIIYVLVYLRLRGNISGQGWNVRFRFIPKEERWMLKLARDEVDGAMFKIARQLIAFPLVFALIVVPIAAARFTEFKMGSVPLWLTITADFFFNLNGFFNTIIFLVMYHRIRQTSSVDLSVQRRSLSATTFGVTPFLVRSNSGSKTSEADLEKGLSESEKRQSNPTIRSFYTSESAPPEMTEISLL